MDDRQRQLERQFVREAKLGMGAIGVALTLLVWAAASRMAGRFDGLAAGGPPPRVAEPPPRTPEFQADPFALDAPPTNNSAPPAFAVEPRANGSLLRTNPAPDIADDSVAGSLSAPPPPPAWSVPTQPAASPARSAGETTPQASRGADPHSSKIDSPRDPSVVPSSFVLDRDPPSVLTQASGEETDPVAAPSLATDRTTETEELPMETPADGRTVRSRPEQSLWSVAEEAYGDGRWFRALAAVNGIEIDQAWSLPTNTAIRLPDEESLRARWAETHPAMDRTAAGGGGDGGSTYVTRGGETPFALAASELGQASRYIEILRLNGDLLAGARARTRLPAGMTLRLPSVGESR